LSEYGNKYGCVQRIYCLERYLKYSKNFKISYSQNFIKPATLKFKTNSEINMPAAFAILAFSIFLALSIYIAWDLNRISKHESAADYPDLVPNVGGKMGVSSVALGSGASGFCYAGNSCANGDGGGGSCSF
jgi:hypothetical protein